MNRNQLELFKTCGVPIKIQIRHLYLIQMVDYKALFIILKSQVQPWAFDIFKSIVNFSTIALTLQSL